MRADGRRVQGLPFFLRTGFHVLHVGTGLRQDVVQIVTDADEREAFFQEFADAGGSEQEQAQDDVVALRSSPKLIGGGAQLRRRVHVGKFVFFVQSHRHAQVVLAEEEEVHTRHRCDLVDIGDAGIGLDLKR